MNTKKNVMRNLLVFFVVLASYQLVGQSIYVQAEQSYGVSSFIQNSSYFKIKYAYQYGLLTGINISEHVDVGLGLSYQSAGAASNTWWNGDIMDPNNAVRQTYNASFLKIPIDVNLRFGKRVTYSMGLGVFYNINLKSSYGTESPEGNVWNTPYLDEFGQNDYGVRLKPSVLFPLNDKFLVQLGILQEFGLNSFWAKTTNYSTSAFIALRYLL